MRKDGIFFIDTYVFCKTLKNKSNSWLWNVVNDVVFIWPTNPDKHCANCHSSGLFEFAAMDLHGRLLAGVLPPNAEKRQHSEINADYSPSANSAHRLREVQVTGTAEVCSPADLASVRVTVGGGSKEKVNEATNSASRRLEYILQAVRWCFTHVFAATHWTNVLSRRQSMLVS